MCSVLGRYKGPGKDLLKNTLKLEKKKNQYLLLNMLTIEQIYESLKI